MVPQAWIKHAYPLRQITVQIQGTRHSDRAAVNEPLETVIARLRAGDQRGSECDDFGSASRLQSPSAVRYFSLTLWDRIEVLHGSLAGFC